MAIIKNIPFLLLCMIIVSCTTDDVLQPDIVDNTPPTAQQVEMLMSLDNRATKPRQAPANTHRAATFQGMELLVAIPFHTNGQAVAATDAPLIDLVGANQESNGIEEHSTYYVSHCSLMTGTDRMLVYGKSKPSSNNKAVNGELSALPTIRTVLDSIRFSLTSIRNTTEVHAEANALATYMTNIAKAEGWSTSEDATLKSYYRDFTRTNADGSGLMSGSAAHIKAFVAVLRAQLAGRNDAVSEAIKTAINDNSSIADNTYPRSIGLPDGAAVIRWMGNNFSVRTTTTTLDNINGINRYTYPAELMFFTDSPIRTSAEEVSKTIYQTTDKLWSAFLDENYNGTTAVSTNTVAVAVENPLQYGVANLRLTLSGMSPTLKDAKEIAVADADMTHLPLRGVVIGGQHTVGYNMKPQGEQTDVDGRFIYETNIESGNSINTLVLQSYDLEKVPVILEFENNTGNAFAGKDGTVYPGTRFYLIGMIDPAGQGTGAYANRVFTQDYTTTMSMSITSLANAYTSMPDLLAPRLEVGVQVITKWVQATTTNVEL